jgi:diacylglycerol kinase (CTP)
MTLGLYASGFQKQDIHPVLFALLIPITTTDFLRHNFPSFNRFYIRVLGALMRESEVSGYNGVIWYLAGAWAVIRFMPKDIGVMGVLLLSWCDTAASTVGRQWGKYTWRLRRGKSAAGSAAALAVGILTAWVFWGFIAPHYGAPYGYDTEASAFAFQGSLSLPSSARDLLGLSKESATISGNTALGVLSVVAGVIASASEAVDLFSWDDNITIPVLCGIGLWAFLKVFGS